MKKQLVGIAMSGGVDSTACALLLREKYDTVGFFMNLGQPDFQQQEARVKGIASKLNIDLNIIDLHREFEDKVLKYFTNTYLAGKTPNPCMICNPTIKFGSFMEKMFAFGIDYAATGHYAKITTNEQSHLLKGTDQNKDQSYFLAGLNQHQLKKTLFPLGEMLKEETYQLVEQAGFLDFRGIESQDVCFLDQNGLRGFLDARKETSNKKKGPIKDMNGKELGAHDGFFYYTIGQRRGLGISSNQPLYVTALDAKSNTVFVGSNDDLQKNHINVHNMNWINSERPINELEYEVKVRYNHRNALAKIIMVNDNECKMIFINAQRAVTPGQFAVIYNGNKVLGSGEIKC